MHVEEKTRSVEVVLVSCTGFRHVNVFESNVESLISKVFSFTKIYRFNQTLLLVLRFALKTSANKILFKSRLLKISGKSLSSI